MFLVHGSYSLEPYHFSACQPDFCQHLYVLPEGSLLLPEPLGLCLVRSAEAHAPGAPSVMRDGRWNMNVRALSPLSWGNPEMCVFHPSQSPRSIKLLSPAWLLAWYSPFLSPFLCHSPIPTERDVGRSPPTLITCTEVLTLGSASGGTQIKTEPNIAPAFLAGTLCCGFILILQSHKPPACFSCQLRLSHTCLMLCLWRLIFLT